MTATERKRRQRQRQREAAALAYTPAPELPAADLAGWCAGLVVTQGHGLGERLTVLPWQAEYLRSVEALAGGELALTLPAGAGKSTLAAAVAAARTSPSGVRL